MKRVRLALGAIALGLLAGCQDSGIDLSARSGPRITVGASLPVSVQQIDGLPEGMGPRFSAALAAEAQLRDIVFVDATQSPRFKIKGYVNAYQAEGGTAVSWVWDVFDTRHSRAQRVSGQQPLGKSASEPWSAVDDTVLRFVAARSLDGIGGFLVGNRSSTGPASADTPMVQRQRESEPVSGAGGE